MLQADGELDEAGCEALQAFLEEHPELAEEMTLFASLKLEPDTTMVFADKESLKKAEPASRKIPLSGWRTLAAAASVAAVIGIAAALYHAQEPHNTAFPVADNHPVTPATRSQAPMEDTAPAAVPVATQPQATPAHNNHIAAVQHSPGKPLQPENKTTVPHTPVQDLAALQPLPATSLSTAPVQPQLTAAALPEHTGSSLATANNETGNNDKNNKRFLAWLPLPEEKKQGLELVKNAIDHRIEQVRELNQNIKETTLVLNIGSKDITVNF